MRLWRRRDGSASRSTPALVSVAACLALGAACAPSAHPGSSSSNLVHVTERDFQISAPQSVSAGDVLFQVQNKGPDSHELIIVRQKGPLPLRNDGMTVNEEALAPVTVGILEPGGVGTRELRAHLRPGHYQLICNMAGHYRAGMDGTLVVH